MGVLGIPHVVVLEPVDVHVQAVRVHVHVSNEELRDVPSVPLPIQACKINYITSRIVLYFIRDLEVRKHTAPTEKFFVSKQSSLF